jgi:hypothetical protein
MLFRETSTLFLVEPKEEATYNSLHSQGSNHEFYHIIASVSLPPYPFKMCNEKVNRFALGRLSMP